MTWSDGSATAIEGLKESSRPETGLQFSCICCFATFAPLLLYFYVVIQISVYLFLIIYVFLRYKAQEETGSAGEQPVSNKLYGCTV